MPFLLLAPISTLISISYSVDPGISHALAKWYYLGRLPGGGGEGVGNFHEGRGKDVISLIVCYFLNKSMDQYSEINEKCKSNISFLLST